MGSESLYFGFPFSLCTGVVVLVSEVLTDVPKIPIEIYSIPNFAKFYIPKMVPLGEYILIFASYKHIMPGPSRRCL